MGCPAEVELEGNLVFSVCTHDPDTGVLSDAAAVPSYRIYEEEGAQVWPADGNAGSMAKLDDGHTTGFYTELVECTTANNFEAGKTYTVYIEATVDGDTGGICYGFTCKTKTGYALSATGLDLITATRPTGKATTFPQMLVQLFYRFFGKATKTSTQIKTYAADGTTVVTTQTVSDDATTETQGEAS